MFIVSNRKCHFQCRIFIHKIGNDKSRTTFFYRIGKITYSFSNIGAGILWGEINQLPDNTQDMAFPFFGRDKLLNSIRKEYHPNFIIVLNGRKGKDSSYFSDYILFHLFKRTEITGTAHINKKHNSQFTFFFKYFNVRMVIPGGNIPVNVSDVVTVLIFPYFRESHTSTLECTVVFTCKDIPGQSPGFNLYLPYTF